MLRDPPLPTESELTSGRQPPEEEVMKEIYRPENWFEEMFGFRREFDELFNRIANRKICGTELPGYKKAFSMIPAVESFIDKEGKKYVCRIVLPGVEPKDVEVHAQANLLTIRAERKLTHTKKEMEFFDEEISYGVFERILPLPEGVLVEKLTAEFVNGVLEIYAPVAAVALPRKIEVRSSVPLTKQIAA